MSTCAPPKDVFSAQALSLLKNMGAMWPVNRCTWQVALPKPMIPTLLKMCIAQCAQLSMKVVSAYLRVMQAEEPPNIPEGYCSFGTFLCCMEHFGGRSLPELQRQLLDNWLKGSITCRLAPSLPSTEGVQQSPCRPLECTAQRSGAFQDCSRSRSPAASDRTGRSNISRSNSWICSSSQGSSGGADDSSASTISPSQLQLKDVKIRLLEKMVLDLQNESSKKDQKVRQLVQKLKREEEKLFICWNNLTWLKPNV